MTKAQEAVEPPTVRRIVTIGGRQARKKSVGLPRASPALLGIEQVR